MRTIVACALTATALLTSLLVGTGQGAEEKCPKSARRSAAPTWPAPPEKRAFDVVHFGEGHWNEGQGPRTMPELIQDVVSYDPEMVLFSADIADIGTFDRMACWRKIIRPSTKRGTSWFQSPGNHDRVAAAGPGGVMAGDIEVWREVFADMGAPWGDAKPKPGILVPGGETDDGAGAATHYYFDFAVRGEPVVRVVVLDNSQQGLTTSDEDQYPAVGLGAQDASQLAFLQRVAAEADGIGLMTWVVMHQPTQDPRDISNVNPVSYNHTMGKGASADNAAFDAVAEVSGVDAVFLGHIQGHALYSFGDVRYFIDGGGGGSPYALHSTGTDTGYFYGFRVLRLSEGEDGWDFRTYLVPLIDHIEVEAPKTATVGDEIEVSATAVQPFDPELPPRLGLAPNEAIRLELRPPVTNPGYEGSVPQLAFMWQSSDPSILRPVVSPADPTDDPRFDPRSMSLLGTFEAVGEGVAELTILSGTHRTTVKVRVVRP